MLLKKTFLIFLETETPPNSYISGSNFTSSRRKKKPTLKKFLILRETDFLAPTLKNICKLMLCSFM